MTVVDPTQAKADTEIANKNYREAIQYLNELIRKNVNRAGNYNKRARCFLELRVNRNGLHDAQNAVANDPQSEDARTTVIECLLSLNELDKTVVQLDELAQINANSAIVADLRPKVNALKTVYAEVAAAMEAADYAKALEKVQQCCDAVQHNSYYRYAKVRVLIYMGKYAEAEKEINDLLFHAKIDLEAMQLRALLLYFKGKETLAQRELEHTERLAKYLGGGELTCKISSNLQTQSHYIKYASKKLDAEDYESAAKFFKQSIELDAHNRVLVKKARHQLAVCYEKLDDHESAIEECAKLLSIDAGNKDVLELQGRCFQKVKQPAKAAENYKKLVQQDGSNTEYRNLLKEAEKQSGSGAAAATDWEVLGVPENATLKQVQDAYKKLAIKHHPDVGKDDKAVEENGKIMERINLARERMEKKIKAQAKEQKAQPPVER